ncbi:MAG: hypothetical protein HYS12_20945, partial [Planctomycetes bacterium]|nr:hypothetical protein [Planctomycetota bacterium]
YHARKVPSLPIARKCDLSGIAAARREATSPPSWTAIMMRAYGLVARDYPELRRALIPWPWTHLYQHPCSECAILVERVWQGEHVVLGAKLRAPEERSLAEIDAYLGHLQSAPVLEVNTFRQVLRIGRLPWLLRRFTFWQSLYLSGFKRAKRFGTFMISSLGNLGAEQIHPLTPLTTYFTFGPITVDGEAELKIIYDHRVLDARYVAHILGDLEHVLNDRLARELERHLPAGDGLPFRSAR